MGAIFGCADCIHEILFGNLQTIFPTSCFQYAKMLGRGACKRVYAAFDIEEGIEVAWNLVELQGVDIDADFRAHLFAEIKVLQQLKHRVRLDQ